MKFDKLYSESLALWPNEVEIYDGERSEEDHRQVSFVRLSLVYDSTAEDAKLLGEWYDLMTWIIFKNMHRLATTNFNRRLETVNKEQLDQEQVKADLLDNLKIAGYETMLAEFERDNA